MTKILVTGAAGLIGRQITQDLQNSHFEVFSSYNFAKPEFGTPIQLDISNKEKIIEVFKFVQPDIILHLAALTDVEKCEKEQELAMLINAKATENLAKESAKQNAFFVYMSTDYVFDGKSGLKNENDSPNPINFYGKSKLKGEISVQNESDFHAIIRTSTPFGIHPNVNTFPIWIKRNLDLKKEIPVLTDQITSPTYVPNLSEMLIEIIEKRRLGVIHLAGSSSISRYDFSKILAEKLMLNTNLLKPTTMNEMNWFASRPSDSSLDVSKASKELTHKPQKIEKSLDLFINQLKNQ